MGRVPISSTLATHASAYSRVVDYAIEQGWLNDRVAIRVFAISSGVRPYSLHSSFELLLADTDMSVDPTTGKNRSLYSLRHS